MKTALIVFFIAVISLGVWAGFKSNGRMCDNTPVICDGGSK